MLELTLELRWPMVGLPVDPILDLRLPLPMTTEFVRE